MPTSRAQITDDTSRAGLYVMLSRAKHDLRGYLIRRRSIEADLDDEDWLPILTDTDGPMRAILDHLNASRTERLASEYDPIAHVAHRLALAHSLPELTRMRHSALDQLLRSSNRASGETPNDQADGQHRHGALVLRRAELAAQARIARAALANPDPDLLARIGPRPDTGPHLALWERVIMALAVYTARNASDAAPGQLLPPVRDRQTGHDFAWQHNRDLAETITWRWAEHLPDRQRRRFHSSAEIVPRERALAGIHALLTAGWTPATLHPALADETTHIRTAAAVLDYRVHNLLINAGIEGEAALFQLPAPLTPLAEWRHVSCLLAEGQSRYLSTRPTGELSYEHHRLTTILTAETGHLGELVTELRRNHTQVLAVLDSAKVDYQSAQQTLAALRLQRSTRAAALHAAQTTHVAARQRLAHAKHQAETAFKVLAAATGDRQTQPLLRQRLDHIDAALAHQIDSAATQIAQTPTPYITQLLGEQPKNPASAAQWQRHAVAVEHYRHHQLGLPYGTPAADDHAPSSEQALGPHPTDPELQHLYDRLHSAQATLELSASI